MEKVTLFNNGEIYTGFFINNAREGYGEICYPNGNKYEGDWKNNQKHGYGIMTIKTEEKEEKEEKHYGTWNNKAAREGLFRIECNNEEDYYIFYNNGKLDNGELNELKKMWEKDKNYYKPPHLFTKVQMPREDMMVDFRKMQTGKSAINNGREETETGTRTHDKINQNKGMQMQ